MQVCVSHRFSYAEDFLCSGRVLSYAPGPVSHRCSSFFFPATIFKLFLSFAAGLFLDSAAGETKKNMPVYPLSLHCFPACVLHRFVLFLFSAGASPGLGSRGIVRIPDFHADSRKRRRHHFSFTRCDWILLSSGRFSRIHFLGPGLVLFMREAGGGQTLAPTSLFVVPRVNIFSFALIPFDPLPDLLYEPPLADPFFEPSIPAIGSSQ
jgi:hypothetical protein